MSVLVSGGAGYIGSHTAIKLHESGRDVVIADNFSNSSERIIPRLEKLSGCMVPYERADLCDKAAVERLFNKYSFDSIIHFAALKAVGESVANPIKYFNNNLISTLNLLTAMRETGVRNFVFSSSATVYGAPASVPITEDFPLRAVNPYGRTKLIIEDILRDLKASDVNFNAAILRYFNVVGTHPSGFIGEAPCGIPQNLFPCIAQVAVGKIESLPVYGNDYPTRDGTGVRDYIHVQDLADGHIAALDRLQAKGGLLTYNLGTGCGYTVFEVIDAYEKASGKSIPVEVMPRRPGDIAECFADASLAKLELGWQAKFSLDDMCRDSWKWQKNNPGGYE